MLKKAMILLMGLLTLSLAACGQGEDETNSPSDKTTITLFAAKSLNNSMDELIELYEKDHADIEIVANYDSSGTLMEQIKEGAECNLFFSAAQKQMDQLESMGLLKDGSRKNVVNNQVCLVTYPESGTKVKGLSNLSDASNLALADGSVPVGKYTRQAMVNAKILPEAEDASVITTEEVSQALGGITINECANVGAVVQAVAEGVNEVGTIYRSDTVGYENKLEILETIPYELTGDVIYPIAQVSYQDATESQEEAAAEFLEFITSDQAKAIFDNYYFDTNVEP